MGRQGTVCNDYVNFETDQLSRESRKLIILAPRSSVVEGDILSLYITEFMQPVSNRDNESD